MAASPSAHIDEFDFQKYLDRVARMRSAISRKQIEIAELRREIDKLPTPDRSSERARPRSVDVRARRSLDSRRGSRSQRAGTSHRASARRRGRDGRHSISLRASCR